MNAVFFCFFFFFNDTATTEIYTLSLHDALRSISAALDPSTDLNFALPNPEDENLSEFEFQRQIELAWQVCDRFDLQTDIWRGRIMRTVRDREKRGGDGRGTVRMKIGRAHV